MATGIFTLRNQIQGLIQKAWPTPQPTYYGSFNGSSQSLTWPSGSSVAFGSGNFTVECWVYLTAAPVVNCLIDFRDASHTTAPTFFWGDVTSGVLTWDFNAAGTSVISATSATWNINTWYHIAYVRNGTIGTIYQNGIAVGTGTDATNYSVTPTTSSIAARYASSFYYFQGYISNLRIVKGTALYTANFGVPNSPLTAVSGTQLLTLQNTTIVDNSSNAFTITNTGSVTTTQTNQTTPLGTIFGNSIKTSAVDYLVVAGGGAGGYWLAAGGGAGGLLQGITTVSSGTSITVTVGAGGTGTTSNPASSGANSVFGSITSTGGGAGAGPYSSGAGIAGGSGGGGTYASIPQIGQGTFGQGNAGGIGNQTDYQGGGGGGVGTVGLNAGSVAAGNGGAGIASAINGTVTAYAGGGGGAVHNGSGTTAGIGGVGGGGNGGKTGGTTRANGTANTGGGGGGGEYVTAGGNGGSGIVIISYPDTYNAPTTLTGTYTASTSGSGSILFNGTSQSIITNSTLFLGSGNFTIEGWFYFNSLAANMILVDTYTSATSGNNYYLNIQSSKLTWNGGVITGATTLLINTWYHLSVVRSSGTTKIYVNGIQDGSASDATNYNSGGTFTVGESLANTNQWLNGYASNIRIVVGTAVYTANFTPSTAPLTSISGTRYLLNTVSGSPLADSSGNNYYPTTTSVPAWNQLSPFATGLGYKNRVYTWTASGTVTF
jgi:hypothetical protein